VEDRLKHVVLVLGLVGMRAASNTGTGARARSRADLKKP